MPQLIDELYLFELYLFLSPQFSTAFCAFLCFSMYFYAFLFQFLCISALFSAEK